MSETSPSNKLIKTKPKGPIKVTKVEPAADAAQDTNTDTAPEGESAAGAAVANAIAGSLLKTKTIAGKPKAAAKEPVDTSAADDDSTDLIVKVAHEVENLTENKAFALVPKLQDNIDHDFFRLGGVLAKIQTDGWHLQKGYENFRGFVEAESGMEYRKAMYFIGIYNGLVQSGVKWDQVKHLGWTKLKELAAILTTENVEEWASLAENMTVLQLIAYIKTQKQAASNQADAPAGDDAAQVTTMTFKLHKDQKSTVREALDVVKATMQTEFDSVALEHMCLDSLAGDGGLKKMPTLVQLMTGKSAEEVLEAFAQVFPEVELQASVPEA